MLKLFLYLHIMKYRQLTKEQFENLNSLFPYIGNSTNFKFNYQDYIMVENSEEEILNFEKRQLIGKQKLKLEDQEDQLFKEELSSRLETLDTEKTKKN